MFNTVLFIGEHRAQIHIFHAVENIGLHERIGLLELRDQFLRLQAFRRCRTVLMAGRAGVRKMARALQKMQLVEFPPCDDIALAHEIHRPNQLHPRKIGAVQLRHHRLHLGAVKHSHQNGFNHIVKMVSERNFVAPELLRLAVRRYCKA